MMVKMVKDVVIIGGGHMGQKLYQHIQGRYNVIMVDTPIDDKKYKKLFYSWEGHKFYIATPDKTHTDWALCTPQCADLLIEKPLVYNVYQYLELVEYAEFLHINVLCNLPWRCLFSELLKFKGLDKVVLQRSKGWMYPSDWKRPCIGIDLGAHIFDLVGSIMGRDQEKFDTIVYNTDDVFEAYYKGVRIRLEYVIEGGKNIVQFKNGNMVKEYNSIMPEEWILKNYELWLAGDTKSFASLSELEWLQKLLEEVRLYN